MPGHTLLYTPDRQHNIWSYQPVEGEGFVSRPLRPDDRVVLKNGAIVSFDGEGVKVNGAHVKAQNAIVQADGKVEEGAFIRTFE
jgi:hypothetical protein